MADKHLIIEGIDNIGKDTLIEGIIDKFGYYQVFHFEKPKCLTYYNEYAIPEREYQTESFKIMLSMISRLNPKNCPMICNRSHLGEYVYSNRYRNYPGDYIFKLEDNYDLTNAKLILLYCKDFDLLRDDGKSFSVSNRESEQDSFFDAFNRTSIRNKIAIPIDYDGKFRRREDILASIL